MTQQSGSQFGDDLTVGMEEDVFATDSIDLLGVGGEEYSPIARLKSIILSIDWEISDEILQQLDDELHDLSEIWASDKIKQVYVQGLSKIGKYIYKEKAAAHPNSIKLLLSFYHNLEKIVVLEEGMSEEEKKQLLLSDVKKFDRLKSQIDKPAAQEVSAVPHHVERDVEEIDVAAEDGGRNAELKSLKALVLGIDWEITDSNLEKLGGEVKRLEGIFGSSKAKLILLQGIGALSSYINKRRSKSNSGAFSLLHSFYSSLEKICDSTLSADKEKQLLLSEVTKFNAFKAQIAQEKGDSPDAETAAGTAIETGEVADVSVAQAQEAPAALSGSEFEEPEPEKEDSEIEADVTSRLSSVFGDEEVDTPTFTGSEKADALAGVDVETEADDDSDEEALPYDEAGVAPALVDAEKDLSHSVEKLADDLFDTGPAVKPEAIIGDDHIDEEDDFELEDVSGSDDLTGSDDVEEALRGVDVETAADDDSDEEALPMEAGELAPALSAADDTEFDSDDPDPALDSSDTDAINDRLGAFFDDEDSDSEGGWVTETSEQLLEADDEIGDRTEAEDDNIIAALSDIDEEDEAEDAPVAALSDEDTERDFSFEDDALGESEESIVEDGLSFLDDDVEMVTQQSSPEAAAATDDVVEESLSFLDDDIESDQLPSEPTQQSSLEEEEAVTDDAVEESLSFLDDDIEPDQLSSETTTDQEDEGSAFEESLSFLDDEIDQSEPAPELAASETDEMIAEAEGSEIGEEGDLSFLDDFIDESEETELFLEEDDAAPADSETLIDEIQSSLASDDPSPQTAEEAALAFFEDSDEETSVPLFEDDVEEESLSPVVESEEEISFEVEAEDISDDDIIEFSIPGEDADSEQLVDNTLQTETDGEEIEFELPDQGIIVQELAAEDSNEFVEEEDENVVFEVVADDVAVDPLPGEEYDDTVEEDSFSVPTKEVEEHYFAPLMVLLKTLRTRSDEASIGSVLQEITQLSNSKDTAYTEKTFLQLLATTVKALVPGGDNSATVELIDNIESGLALCRADDFSNEELQEKLFNCTCQVLLLPVQEQEDTLQESSLPQETSEDVAEVSGRESYEAAGDEEDLAAFVQKELADIRKLFVDEIANLRKELAEK